VAVVAVLALASLSTVAAAAPPVLVDQCVEGGSLRFEQYQAAIAWAENGGDMPAVLSTVCEVAQPEVVSYADSGGESWVRWEQYMAAIEGSEQVAVVAPAFKDQIDQLRFGQYQAAIDGTAQPLVPADILSGGTTVGNGFVPYGGESWARFEQYMAASTGSE
jgi:hypothetical protein